VTEIPTFDEERMLGAIGDGRIFLNGGGNFGDIWAGYRQFREGMLERHKGRPIVQLPQTIHFKDQENVDSTARAIEKHGQFTLLVRDKKSLAFAQRWFQCETRLCPDMAFCIGPVAKPVPQHELAAEPARRPGSGHAAGSDGSDAAPRHGEVRLAG
jgi:exopolysaccharide biosynthesis predicted pyruvyltransferase EpsI